MFEHAYMFFHVLWFCNPSPQSSFKLCIPDSEKYDEEFFKIPSLFRCLALYYPEMYMSDVVSHKPILSTNVYGVCIYIPLTMETGVV